MSFHQFIRRFQQTLYIQFTRDWLSVTCVETQQRREDLPILALNTNGSVIAFGTKALQCESAAVVAPFAHPRLCISDYWAAEGFIKLLIYLLAPRRWIKPAIVIHPLEQYEGDLTPVEILMLHDLIVDLGAWQHYVWIGRVLTAEELRQLAFPLTEGRLAARPIPG